MNDDSNRSELNALKAELERVELDLRFLRVKAEQIEWRIAEQGNLTRQTFVVEEKPVTPPTPAPPPIPTPISNPTRLEIPSFIGTQLVEKPKPVVYEKPAPLPPREKRESLEMRLGTYWFVRIGIVMVLTAMVFLGNYAYQHYIGLLGPLGKVILLYLTSAGLLAAGTILPRKEERFRNYAQVLFAGGLAAIYFTTYAAHHFKNLRVIESALLDGVLLLGWTSYIVWLADRKKSEVLAVFAIGLAYYTALITNVGNFTLVSNLFLAAAAVFFLVRNRWLNLTFLSLAASYGSYFYWRYYAGATGIEESAGRLSLCGYWIVFTAAVFLSRHAEFSGPRRAGFLSFNNAAAFILLTYSFVYRSSGHFWQLALAAGALLLALSYAAFKLIRDDEMPRRAYLAQGIVLITLGIITKLSGPTLALVLGVESALLLIFSTQWNSNFVRAGSIITAMLSVGWLTTSIKPSDPAAWAEAAGVFALLLFNAFWSAKHEPENGTAGTARPLPTYFAAFGLFAWTVATFSLAQPLQIAPILAITAVALTASHYLFRVSEVALLGQTALGIAQGQLLILLTDKQLGLSWSPAIVVVLSLAMSFWWRRQKHLQVEPTVKQLLEVLFAFAGAVITQLYLPQTFHTDAVITASWILTAAWTLLAVGTRSWPIAVAGQMFLFVAWFKIATGMFFFGNPDSSHHSLEIIGALVALGATANALSKRFNEVKQLRVVPALYQWPAALLALVWVHVHLPEPFAFIVLTCLFAVSFVITLAGPRYVFAPGVMLGAAGLFIWAIAPRTDAAQIQNLVAIITIGALQFVARKKSPSLHLPEPAHQLWVIIASVALWAFTSRWVIVHSSGAHFYLTASWAVTAFILFGVGFLLRELAYRWVALTILACALGRVVMLDVWKLEVIYRILSFFALGIVLLALGYVYTRQSIAAKPSE